MNETILFCRYDNREDALAGYLYDEIAPAERTAFDAHLATCERCRLDLAELKSVRAELGAWAMPEFVPLAHDGLRVPKRRLWAALTELPVWAQAAAAALVLGASLGLMNLDIRYDHGGLTVHTGWMRAAAASAPAAADNSVVKATAASNLVAAPVSTPWRDDLADLARQLRSEMHSAQPPAPTVVRASASSDADVLRRVRALVEESERRQQNELALRIAQVVNDVSAQRQADLRNISHSLGQMQNNTGVEVMRQQQMLNYLMRVSQTAPAPK